MILKISMYSCLLLLLQNPVTKHILLTSRKHIILTSTMLSSQLLQQIRSQEKARSSQYGIPPFSKSMAYNYERTIEQQLVSYNCNNTYNFLFKNEFIKLSWITCLWSQAQVGSLCLLR